MLDTKTDNVDTANDNVNTASDNVDAKNRVPTSDVFVDFIADTKLMNSIHWIRKVGILAVHDGKGCCMKGVQSLAKR